MKEVIRSESLKAPDSAESMAQEKEDMEELSWQKLFSIRYGFVNRQGGPGWLISLIALSLATTALLMRLLL